MSQSSNYKKKLTGDETIDFLADIVIERIIEEKNRIKEKMKNDPNAKKIYGTCECNTCWIKRLRIAAKQRK